MTRTTVRFACPVCEGKGEVSDEDMSTGWRTCSACMGQCWVDETPQEHPTTLEAPVWSGPHCQP